MGEIMEKQITPMTTNKSPPELMLSKVFDNLVDEIRHDVSRRERRRVVQFCAIKALAGAMIVLHRIDTAASGELMVDAPMIKAYYRLRRKMVRLSAMLGYPDPLSACVRNRPPARDESDDGK